MTMQISLPRWALPASLLLNVFFVGVVTALALPLIVGAPRPHHHGPPDALRMADEMAATLPEADATLLRHAFEVRKAVIRDNQAKMAAFPDRLRAATDAEPFRIDALAAVFADGQAARNAFEEAIAVSVLDAVGQMSQEGRHRLAAWQPGRPDRLPPPLPDRR